MSADIFIFPTLAVERNGGTYIPPEGFRASIRLGLTASIGIVGDPTLRLVELKVLGQTLNLTPEQADEISAALHRASFRVTGGLP